MATLGTSAYTLTDIAKTFDPDGKPARIVEMLSQKNEMLQDMVFVEGNLPTGHRTTVRTSLPTPTWRLINNGVTPTTTDTAQIDEQCGMLEAYSNVDKDLAELNGSVAGFRLQNAGGHIEGMNQEAQSTLVYGNAGTAPEEFDGFATRYNDLSGPANAQNIINGGGSGADNTSIWLVGWGPLTCHGIFPKGSQAGLFHEDLGLQTVTVGTGISGSLLRAYQDHFQWKIGLAIPDWRYVVRIANIDVSALVGKTSAADLFDLMIKAISVMPETTSVSPVFYMNRTTFHMLWIQGRDDVQTGGGLTFETVGGSPVRTFMGIPVRLVDAITVAEATVA